MLDVRGRYAKVRDSSSTFLAGGIDAKTRGGEKRNARSSLCPPPRSRDVEARALRSPCLRR